MARRCYPAQYFDGGSRGNPGEAGCGAALFRHDARSSPVATRSAYLGKATSNEAEYQGLIMGLQLAAQQGAREVAIRGDSKLVISQLLGQWQVRLACALAHPVCASTRRVPAKARGLCMAPLPCAAAACTLPDMSSAMGKCLQRADKLWHLQVKNPRLARLLNIVNRHLLPQFNRWQACHVYRASNSTADQLANDAMDQGRDRHVAPQLPSSEYN